MSARRHADKNHKATENITSKNQLALQQPSELIESQIQIIKQFAIADICRSRIWQYRIHIISGTWKLSNKR
jgi:hypothetical protein